MDVTLVQCRNGRPHAGFMPPPASQRWVSTFGVGAFHMQSHGPLLVQQAPRRDGHAPGPGRWAPMSRASIGWHALPTRWHTLHFRRRPPSAGCHPWPQGGWLPMAHQPHRPLQRLAEARAGAQGGIRKARLRAPWSAAKVPRRWRCDCGQAIAATVPSQPPPGAMVMLHATAGTWQPWFAPTVQACHVHEGRHMASDHSMSAPWPLRIHGT